MTAEEKEIIQTLYRCTFEAGSWDKKFIRDHYKATVLHPDAWLSEKQHEWTYRLLYKYRAQVPDVYEKYKYHRYCKKVIR